MNNRERADRSVHRLRLAFSTIGLAAGIGQDGIRKFGEAMAEHAKASRLPRETCRRCNHKAVILYGSQWVCGECGTVNLREKT